MTTPDDEQRAPVPMTPLREDEHAALAPQAGTDAPVDSRPDDPVAGPAG